MGKPFTAKQMKDALDRWGCWAYIDAVGRMNQFIADSEEALIQARRDYLPRHFAVCQLFGVDPFRCLYDPNQLHLEWEEHIADMRRQRDKTKQYMDAIESAIRTLTESQQQIIRTKYAQFKDNDAACTALGISKRVLYAQHGKAVNKLRMMFTPAKWREPDGSQCNESEEGA